jgi:hypothetical protein
MSRVQTIYAGALVLTLSIMGLGCASAGDTRSSAPMVVDVKSDQGQVWVSSTLARQRMEESFIPLVVAVYNRESRSLELTRSSFVLVDSAGTRYPMPEIPELREGYSKVNFDLDTLVVFGIPFGTRLQEDRYMPANFFPATKLNQGVKIDSLYLPRLYWTVDLLYFRRPLKLAQGSKLTLEVSGEGWKEPLRVPFSL